MLGQTGLCLDKLGRPSAARKVRQSMKHAISASVALSLGLLGVVLAGAPSAGASAPSPSSAAAARPSEPVIIVLKKQYSFPGTINGTVQRTKAADAAQAPVLASIRRSHATHVTQLHLI